MKSMHTLDPCHDSPNRLLMNIASVWPSHDVVMHFHHSDFLLSFSVYVEENREEDQRLRRAH